MIWQYLGWKSHLRHNIQSTAIFLIPTLYKKIFIPSKILFYWGFFNFYHINSNMCQCLYHMDLHQAKIIYKRPSSQKPNEVAYYIQGKYN